MDESKGKHTVKANTTAGSPAKAPNSTTEDRDGSLWIRADGAICVGNECMVIKRAPDGTNLDIEIAPTKCGAATADALLDELIKTVGHGGNTRFTVKSEFREEDKPKLT
jgi:hypothetical protein